MMSLNAIFKEEKLDIGLDMSQQSIIYIVGYIPYKVDTLASKIDKKGDSSLSANEFRTLTDVSSDEFHVNIAQVQDTLIGGLKVVGIWSPSIKDIRKDVLKLYCKNDYFLSFPTKHWLDHDSMNFLKRIESSWIDAIVITSEHPIEFKNIPLQCTFKLPSSLAQYRAVYFPRYSFNEVSKKIRMKHCCRSLDPKEGNMVVHIVPKNPLKHLQSKDDNLDSNQTTKSDESGVGTTTSNTYIKIQPQNPSHRRTHSLDSKATFKPHMNIVPEYECILLYNTSSVKNLLSKMEEHEEECMVGEEGSFILVCLSPSIDLVHQHLFEDVKRSLRCRALFNLPVYRKIGPLSCSDATWYISPQIHLMSSFVPQSKDDFPSEILNERYVLQKQHAMPPMPPIKAINSTDFLSNEAKTPWYATTGCSILFFSVLLAFIALFMILPSRQPIV
eukprot:CAMPEP_0117422168 /NCGR_PEP_ID=MMETSP0758-20121206/3063_1 /TAXON_ID=63605 /ORGANISM="Percolomonas cosmopolitus, Strain AE-1 (ATCC 50343)" /LENGTH=442 /DNA_ID=CAMNT_0005204629 /DNA_START=164 /DNA_END=1492 /DNA_ORIENTATION=-